MNKTEQGFCFITTPDAKDKIARRKISIFWIFQVLKRPDKIEPHGTRPWLQHSLGKIEEENDKVLHVVHHWETYPLIVISVYFDHKYRGKL